MRPNIRKAFYLFLFLLSFGKLGYSQTLNQAPVLLSNLVNLNTDLGGGVVYDVAEDPYNDFYVIVGDFHSVNGITVNNIAFLNRSDLSVATTPTGAISSIDGIIRSVDIKRVYVSSGGPLPTISIREVMYIGGNFNTINGSSHKGVAKFIRPYSGISYSTLYGLNGWNPQMSFTSTQTGGVHDILFTGDTVVFCGQYSFAASLPHSASTDITAFKSSDNSYASNMFTPSLYLTNDIVYKISKFYNNYYASGSDNSSAFLSKHNQLGDQVSSSEFYSTYAPAGNNPDHHITNFEFVNDQGDNYIIVNGVYLDVFSQPQSSITDLNSDGSSTPSCSNPGALCRNSNAFNEQNIAQYRNQFYKMSNTTLSYNDMDLAFTSSKIDFDILTLRSPDINTTATVINGMHVLNNKLFVSLPNLETADGENHNGLAVYCLRPGNTSFFTVSDSTVCAGDTITYTIPTAEYADGYYWEYTGTGVDIDLLGGPHLNGDTDINTAQIAYLSNFTPGQLKVTPYSDFGGSDKVYSNTITTNIAANPLPNAFAGLDTTLNCFRDSLILIGSSTSPNTSYAWLDNNTGFVNVNGTDSLVSTEQSFFISGTEYIFRVTDDILGCVNYDTVIVTLDNTPPNVTLPSIAWETTCDNPTISLVGSSSTNGVTFSWNGPTGTINDTTLNADASMVGNWYLTVTDTSNGCSFTEGSVLVNNVTPPTPEILHLGSLTTYTPIPLVMPEILTCDNDTIIYVCTTQTPNSVARWRDENGNLTNTDTLIITVPGDYFFNVRDNSNGCDIEKTVRVNANFDLPILSMPTLNTINCSRDTLILDGTTISLDTTLLWNGPTYVNEPNPLTTNQTGWHYFTVTRTDNGCSLTDSIDVVVVPTIDVFADEDTLVCKQTDVMLNVIYDGTLTNVNYNWNNGNITSSAIYNSGSTNEATVIITADNGCIGYDTVKINTPNTPTASFQTFSPCDGGASGKVIVTAIDGLNPYTYSIGDGPFQSSTLFEDLAIGTYSIDVADSIGCQYSFNTEITDVGQLPEPLFIFSTYNVQADTVVLVDVSTPPADHIDWEFPFEVTVFDDENINSPVIILPDTGAFEITMNAHYGSCIIPVTKWIYSNDYDSTLATNYNLNGIKSVELYPNPNTGVFTVEIEFYNRQHSVTTVQDMAGYSYYWQENNEDDLIVTHNIDLGANIQPGTYVLKVASEFDSYYVTFVVN